jgi:hypothetical protein
MRVHLGSKDVHERIILKLILSREFVDYNILPQDRVEWRVPVIMVLGLQTG